jgi:hypothetical protein
MLRLLEGKHKHSTVQQAMIDMARDRTGRKAHAAYESRKSLALAIPVESRKIRGEIYSPFDVVTIRLFIEKICRDLTPVQKGIMFYYLAGYNMNDIAKELGFSPTWVSIQWSQAIDYLKAIANK